MCRMGLALGNLNVDSSFRHSNCSSIKLAHVSLWGGHGILLANGGRGGLIDSHATGFSGGLWCCFVRHIGKKMWFRAGEGLLKKGLGWISKFHSVPKAKKDIP